MNDTKMDIQRSGETIEKTAVKYSGKATKGVAKLMKMITLYGIKMFANPLNAIKKDGPNKTLIHTPELTKEEAKVMIAKLREAEILATYREVEPSGREIRRGVSIHNQEKMAKNDIKLAQWKDRAAKYERFAFVGKFCESQADKYQSLVNQENKMSSENKYIFIVNQRHSNALNEMLADIREMRLTKDFDNSVFEKEMDESQVPELKIKDMELTVESMEEGIEYGNRMISEFPHADTCRHIISKEEFVEHYEDMCSQEVFGAVVQDEGHVMVIYHKSSRERMEEIIGTEGHKIIEYGANGGETLQNLKNGDVPIHATLSKEEMKNFREKYEGYDYIIRKQEDGTYEIHVSEYQTKAIEREMKLKNQQAHEDSKQQEQSIDLTKDSVQKEDNSISWAEKDMTNQEDLNSLNEFDLELNKEDE
ncbi:hypothetical protein MKC55_20615 [[Clostridium] innocuum]|nr:hypothetical protein [[Clostridium] innocuum]